MSFCDKMKLLGLHLDRYIDYATLRGIPYKAIIQGIDYPPAAAGDAARTIDAEDFYTVMERISAGLDDKLLGIRVGGHLNLNTLGAIFRISQKTATVEEALYYCQAYLMATLPFICVVNSIDDEAAVVHYHIDNPNAAVNRVVLETVLTIVAREMKILCGEDTEIRLYSPYCDGSYPAGWQKGTAFLVQFDKVQLKAAQKNNSHWGLDLLIPEYLGLIERVKADEAFGSKVRKEMLFMAKPDLPPIGPVAYSFNLTTRTLQRRLKEEGTSFREIAEGLNREISHLLIRHERFPIGDMANLLGYADSASFIHMFNKWFGCSPQKFRAELAMANRS